MVHVCAPSTGKIEAGGLLEFSRQPARTNWQTQAPLRHTVSKSREVTASRRTPEVNSLWPPHAHTWIHSYEGTHILLQHTHTISNNENKSWLMNMQASLNKWAALNCEWGTQDRVHYVRLTERQIVIVLTSRSGKGLVTQEKKPLNPQGRDIKSHISKWQQDKGNCGALVVADGLLLSFWHHSLLSARSFGLCER